MAKAKKKVEDALTETVASVAKDITDTVKTAVKSAASGADEHTIMLRRLQDQYSKATLKIYRKGKNNRDELFVVLEGQDLKEIEEGGGLDTLCLAEGGGGQYIIHVVPPGGGDAPHRIGPLNVSGAPPRMMPRSKELHDQNQFGFQNSMAGFGAPLPNQPTQQMGGFGTPLTNLSGGGSTVHKGNAENTFQIKDVASYMKAQSAEAMRAQEQASDRVVMLQQQMQQQQMMMQQQMQQQQRESSQQMMTLLASMFQNNNQAPNAAAVAAENAEVRMLKEQLDQMKHQREQDERFRAQERQMEDLKRTIELQKVEQNSNKGNPVNDLLMPLLTSQQSQAQNQTSQMLEIMRMANDKPGEDEKMSNIFSTLTMSNQATMNMIMEIARSGLLGGGDDHPIRDAILQGLDAARDLGIAALTREQEEPQQPEMAPMEPMPEPMEPQLEAPVEGSLGGLSEELDESPETDSEVIDIPPQKMLTEEEMDRFMRDAALQRIIASLMNSDHVSDATARIYGHAASGNSIAAKWLAGPETVTKQLFELFEIDSSMTTNDAKEEVLLSKALIDNIYDFSEFMRAKGDANKWATTGYKPLRKRAANRDKEFEDVTLANSEVISNKDGVSTPAIGQDSTELEEGNED